MSTITFCSFYSLDELNMLDYDIKLHITRYTNCGIRNDFIHIPQLSPSPDLFSLTMKKWKKLIFTKEEKKLMSVGKTGTWFDLYEIRFLDELNMKFYNRLKEHLDNGKNIICVCYCEDKYKCHRSIIANKLKEEGYNVNLY